VCKCLLRSLILMGCEVYFHNLIIYAQVTEPIFSVVIYSLIMIYCCLALS